MSRKRSISTDISTDPRIADLMAYGTLPALLYTWAIPHADDWGRLSGDPRQFRMTVCPALDATATQVDEALDQIALVGLWDRYEVDGRRVIAFPQEAWYRHQSYIAKGKRTDDKSLFPPPNTEQRRKSPQNAAEPREVQQNPASPSPSPTSAVVVDPARAQETAEGVASTDTPERPAAPLPVEITQAAAAREIVAGWHEVTATNMPPAILRRLVTAAAEGVEPALLREIARRCASPTTRRSAPWLSQVLSDIQRLGTLTLDAFLASEAEDRARGAPAADRPKERPKFMNGFV